MNKEDPVFKVQLENVVRKVQEVYLVNQVSQDHQEKVV